MNWYPSSLPSGRWRPGIADSRRSGDPSSCSPSSGPQLRPSHHREGRTRLNRRRDERTILRMGKHVHRRATVFSDHRPANLKRPNHRNRNRLLPPPHHPNHQHPETEEMTPTSPPAADQTPTKWGQIKRARWGQIKLTFPDRAVMQCFALSCLLSAYILDSADACRRDHAGHTRRPYAPLPTTLDRNQTLSL
jgi:hypothetical protein